MLYRGTTVDKKKMNVLSQTPGSMILSPMDEIEIEVETEKGKAKVRYEMMGLEEDDKDGSSYVESESERKKTEKRETNITLPLHKHESYIAGKTVLHSQSAPSGVCKRSVHTLGS